MPKNPADTGVDQSQTSSAGPAAAITSVAAPSNHADLRAHRIALTLPSPAVGEPQVVPLAAVTLTQQEWDAIGKHAVTHIPRNMRGIGFGMLLDALDEDDRAYMMTTVPAPMRLLSPLLVARPWKKYAATLRTGT